MTTSEDKVLELMGLVRALEAAAANEANAAEGITAESIRDAAAACDLARSTLESALRAVVEDAMRYQSVRGKFILSGWGSVCIPTGHTKFSPEQTDATIDRARKGDQSAGEPS